MLAAIVCGMLTGARGAKPSLDGRVPKVSRSGSGWVLIAGPPCANSFRNLLLALPPETLEGVPRQWMQMTLDQPLPEETRGASLDGKTLCNTLAAFRNAAICVFRLCHCKEIATTLRDFSYRPLKLLPFLGIMKN
jgi:hypothetical protein